MTPEEVEARIVTPIEQELLGIPAAGHAALPVANMRSPTSPSISRKAPTCSGRGSRSASAWPTCSRTFRPRSAAGWRPSPRRWARSSCSPSKARSSRWKSAACWNGRYGRSCAALPASPMSIRWAGWSRVSRSCRMSRRWPRARYRWPSCRPRWRRTTATTAPAAFPPARNRSWSAATAAYAASTTCAPSPSRSATATRSGWATSPPCASAR